ncbi:ABC transporter ATP-binding protein [uncultured Desulfovibrio sp.]|uniref:ABC transporter ATP-binding protein n=1 Tax=uncultured Desulfovibrio sp. TaxID=167968 RepID=UPI002602527A|nr:ABC transporter ATP-binding protein [uncultured Desulfovibrio sp.]
MNCEQKALVLHGVSKAYRMYDKAWKKLLALFFRSVRGKAEKFFAVRDIDMEVAKGECVGIVGRNGAGKSTLLQLITGTLAPSSGRVCVNGRLAALLELGSGFNADFTGHQNILINAAVLGLSRAEIQKSYHEIVEFADIGDFLHRPVRTYSSGMAMRLAFAVQIMVRPDILIVDEVLAVGDAAFQLKCLERMRALLQSGATILFVSHDMGVMQNFCTRIYWLDHGRIRMAGPTADVLNRYAMHLYTGLEYGKRQSLTQVPGTRGLEQIRKTETAGAAEIELLEAGLLNAAETERVHAVSPGEQVCFVLTLCVHRNMAHPHIFVCLQDRNGQRIFTLSSLLLGVRLEDVEPGSFRTLRFRFAFPFLFHGSYTFAVSAVDGTLGQFSMLHMATGISPVSVRNVEGKNSMALLYLNDAQVSLTEVRHA